MAPEFDPFPSFARVVMSASAMTGIAMNLKSLVNTRAMKSIVSTNALFPIKPRAAPSTRPAP